MSINLLKLNKKNIIKLFIFLSFIICWQSISTTFDDLIIKKNLSEINFFEIVNFIRHFLIYSIFPILLILNIYLFNKIQKKEIKFNFLILSLIFLYFLSQVPGLIFTDNSIYNISFVISSLCLILTINIGNYYLSEREKNVFIYISLFFLIIMFLILYPKLVKILLDGEISFYGYFIYEDPLFFNKESPRATGTSRSILFIIIFIDIICVSTKFKYKKIISSLIRTFGFYNIYLFQSRTVIFLMLIYILFILIFQNEKTFKNFFKNIFLYIMIPLTLVYFTFSASLLIHQNKENIITKGDTFFEKLYNHNQQNFVKLPTRKVKEGNFSSGRYNDWVELYNKLNKSPFIGHGSQADRYLINQSASNGLLYSASSSGILGSIFFIIFSFLIFLKVFKNLIDKKLEFKFKIISMGILCILGRSVLESSYAVFSVDLILLCTMITLLDFKKINE